MTTAEVYVGQINAQIGEELDGGSRFVNLQLVYYGTESIWLESTRISTSPGSFSRSPADIVSP